MSNLKYTVKSFDPVKKILTVDFGVDGWASITLASPLPTNQKELEAVIRRYAPAHEQVQAVKEPTDLSYIDQMVGNSYTTTRFRLNGELIEQEAPTAEELAELENAEFAALEEKVVQVLKNRGLL